MATTTPRDDHHPPGEKDLVVRLINAAHDVDHRLSQQEVDTILGIRPQADSA